ncbi:MAG TPA: PAS domain-containing protein, partial [Pirellulales bacterium]
MDSNTPQPKQPPMASPIVLSESLPIWRTYIVPLAILLAGLGLTVWAFFGARAHVIDHARLQFEFETDQAASAIAQQLDQTEGGDDRDLDFGALVGPADRSFFNLEIYQGDEAIRQNLRYPTAAASEKPAPTGSNIKPSEHIPLFQRQVRHDSENGVWLFVFSSRAEFEQTAIDELMPQLVLWGGVMLSILLSGILWSAGSRRASAIALARQVTVSLRESEQRLKAILDNTSAVVYLKDTAGRYLLVNRRFEELFHRSGEAVVGKTDQELFPAADAKLYQENDRRVMTTGKSLEVEERVACDDGMHAYISNKFALVDPHGKPYAVGGISSDVTALKLAEQAVR